MSVSIQDAAINPATGNPLRVAAVNPATEGNKRAARAAIAKLRKLDEVQADEWADTWNLAREEGRYTSRWAYEQTSKVFKLIDEIKVAAPKPEVERHSVPTGRYAVGPADATKFYRVVVSDNGFTKVQVQASDDLHELRWSAALPVLRQIEQAGIEAARTRYGVEIGRCWACGRTLTDPDSRAAGIGPDCAKKH